METASLSLNVLLVLLAAVGIIIAYHAMKKPQAGIMLSIHSTWGEIYPQYKKMKVKPVDLESLKKKHGNDVNAFMASGDWLEIRPVFAFYEFIGTCLEGKLIERDIAFSLVNLDYRLWENYADLIGWLRSEKGDNLYELFEKLARSVAAHD